MVLFIHFMIDLKDKCNKKVFIFLLECRDLMGSLLVRKNRNFAYEFVVVCLRVNCCRILFFGRVCHVITIKNCLRNLLLLIMEYCLSLRLFREVVPINMLSFRQVFLKVLFIRRVTQTPKE